LSSSVLASAVCLAALACGGGGGEGDGGSGESGTGDETTTGAPMPADTSTGPTTQVETTDDPTGVMETTPEPECGNGIVEDPEQCDDGNQMPGDGCDVDCTEVIDTTQWSDVVDGMAGVEESGQGVAIDGEGNVLVVGYIVDVVSAPDIWVRKYDPAGAVVWTVTFDPGMGLDDRGYGVDVDGAGNIAIAGDVGVDASTSDTWVALLDAEGTLVWSVTADGPQGNTDIAEDVAFDSAGAVWAVGSVRTGANDTDIWVAKYDGAGAEITSDVVPGPAALEDRALGVDVDAEDNAFVAGFVSDEAFARDVWLRKYDTTGDEAWTVTWNSDNDGADAGFDVVVAPDGTIGVAGFTSLTAVNEDVWLGRFLNADGTMMWQKRFGGPNILNDQGIGVAADADNNFIVAGFKGVSDVDTDIWVGKWDSPGSEVWIQSFAGAGGDRDEARAIAVDAAGDLAVTGQMRARANNNGDIWVAKLGGVP
jgi:cysteine-rich repeat protein